MLLARRNQHRIAGIEEALGCGHFHALSNPRYDGYQPLVGSSRGSAAATTPHPWLDISSGSDSKRVQAVINGNTGLQECHS